MKKTNDCFPFSVLGVDILWVTITFDKETCEISVWKVANDFTHVTPIKKVLRSSDTSHKVAKIIGKELCYEIVMDEMKKIS